jgi:uncharacterized protein YukJ
MPYKETLTKYSGRVSVVITDIENNKIIKKEVTVPYYVGGPRSDDNKLFQKILKKAIYAIPEV